MALVFSKEVLTFSFGIFPIHNSMVSVDKVYESFAKVGLVVNKMCLSSNETSLLYDKRGLSLNFAPFTSDKIALSDE
jgi:hypothetical protein